MDLTPLMTTPVLSPSEYPSGFFERVAGEVQGRLARLEDQAP